MTNIDDVSREDLIHQFERLDARMSLLCLQYGHTFDHADREMMKIFGYVTPSPEEHEMFGESYGTMIYHGRVRILELGL